jgi:hypothetical protein
VRRRGSAPDDAIVPKPKAWHVTGGRAFGYTNVEIKGVDGRRSHVEEINEAEAAIGRDIFDRSAARQGCRPAAWAPSSIREVLHRER